MTHSVMPHKRAAVPPLYCVCRWATARVRTCAGCCMQMQMHMHRVARAWAAPLFDEHVSTNRIG